VKHHEWKVAASEGSYIVSWDGPEGLQEYLAESLLTDWAKRAMSEPLDAYLARCAKTTGHTVGEVEEHRGHSA